MDIEQFIKHVESNRQNDAFYHFTDTRNLPAIKANGLLAMAELRRRRIEVPAPGGNQWSFDQDVRSGMDEYVHLTFAKGHPMEHSARNEGRIVDLFHIRVKPSVLRLPGVLATKDIANKVGVVPVSIPELLNGFDFEVIYTRMNWKDPAINARLQAAQKCEIIVPKAVATEYLTNLL